jgi:hypothetical protein
MKRIILAGIVAAMPMSVPVPVLALDMPSVEAPFKTETVVDLGEFQAAMQKMLNSIRQDSRCADNWNVWDAKVMPNGGSIKIDLQARYFLNKCVIVTVPEWQGLWTVRMKDRVVGETILVSQQAHLAVDVTPVISNGVVTATADVVTADANGLLGRLKITGQIKSFLNDKLNAALQDKLKAALPPELVKAGVQISELQFIDLGGGKLGLKLKASGTLRTGL